MIGCCKSKNSVENSDANDSSHDLMHASLDIPDFSVAGYKTVCKVVDVYDGDTCKVVFMYNGKLSKWTVRLSGYDTPEIRLPKNLPNRDFIKAQAILARNYLKSLIMSDDKFIFIQCGPFEKFGRITGTLYLENPENNTEQKSVNQMMIDSKHGVPINY